MRKFCYLLFLTLVSGVAIAQKNGSVKGIVYDTLGKMPVSGATITVLDRKDSSLVSFTMTGNDGVFELKGIPNGAYRLLVTHTSYHNSNRLFVINDEEKQQDLGQVIMNDKAKVLEEVVLSGEAPPVTMIGDTLQYNAGSFKVQPNATVEQLLKKLPGVKVEKDGTIKAQGENVTKVLVDGKEFFGNDPKVATKNLPADAIDKVQVYDKQSDQAQLTGFEDGNYEKTINLKLKKDKKKGVFGKVNGGVGNRERYEGRFNVNSFKGARQLSAIGMANNTNAEGFSFMDIMNFTGELARMQRAGGGNINISMTGDEASAMGLNPGGSRSGINTVAGTGVNYNNIIGTKLDLMSNYFYNRYNPKQESHINRQYILPDSSWYYNQDAYSDNVSNSHRLNLNLLYQVDSMNTIRLIPSFSFQRTNNFTQSNYQTLREDLMTANQGFSNTESISEGFNFRNEITWRKKFARRGRTFSLSLQTTLNKSEGEGSLYSINNFYTTSGNLLRRDTLNQNNKTEADLRGYNVRAVYTEPLWKRSLLELSVSKSDTRNQSEKLTYDFNDGNGKFDQLNDMLSNDFENTYGYTNAGIRLRTQRKKYNYSIGASWQHANLEGKITAGSKDSLISKSFTNILPNARFQYNFTRYKSFSVTYSTATNQPAMAQLQPVPDNSNPLNIREGNPDLKQEFSHNIQANLNFISPFKNKNFFFFFRAQSTSNRIVNYDTINQFGIKTTRPVNVDGVYNLNAQVSYSMPVRFLKGNIELRSNAMLMNNKQFINGNPNSIRTLLLGPEVRLETNPTEKLNLSFTAGVNINRAKYSLQESLDRNYISQEYETSVDWEMPKSFFFSTEFQYTVNNQLASGFNAKIPIWNASISKQMLKYKRGEFKLSVRDLLNQNIGISRTTGNNYIEDARVLTLRRFFLVSFTYSLSKIGLNNGGNGGMRIITR